jgi:hypothetical protein
MANYTVVDNNVVSNVIVAEAEDIPFIINNHQLVQLQSSANEGPGWTYNSDGTFTPPAES